MLFVYILFSAIHKAVQLMAFPALFYTFIFHTYGINCYFPILIWSQAFPSLLKYFKSFVYVCNWEYLGQRNKRGALVELGSRLL